MNKIRLTIVVWATLLTLSVYAQQNIERMLPAFATLENIKVTESIDNGTWSQYEAPFYSVIIENVPIEIKPNEYDYAYLKAKKERMGHDLHL